MAFYLRQHLKSQCFFHEAWYVLNNCWKLNKGETSKSLSKSISGE